MNSSEVKWANLMRAANAGDTMAYNRLLHDLTRVLRGQVRRALMRAGQGHADPEDIVQEILLAVHLKRNTWRPHEPFGPWIRAIARYKTIDAMRRRGWRTYLPLDDFAETLAAEESQPQLSSRDLNRHLERLPPGQRDVVEAIAVSGFSIAETASRLQTTPGAVRVALHRGLAALAKTQ